MKRRDFIKRIAAFSATSAAATIIPGVSFSSIAHADDQGITWKKAPCRFCGVGCGLLIGVSNSRAVAVKGDPASPVNKGLACVKGYHSIQALYGKDRLQKAYVRDASGKLAETPVKDALKLVASKMQESIKARGTDSVSIYGSGQWTIPDGYVASKLFKGCIGTNNVEANARLCMASAVTGFLTSFGADEPMGCYDDIDYGDIFVTWGNNMAEMHPVLFSRVLDRRAKNRGTVKIIDFATRVTRTSKAADKSIMFQPQTDLAVANAICYEIIRNGKVNQEFIDNFVAFRKGQTQIGYCTVDKETLTNALGTEASSFEEYKAFLEDYTPEKVETLSGVPASDIRYLAEVYADPKLKCVSFWCMGANQHTRGTWINNLIYNIHLLTGKISQPGNSPFSLTGQPSACGTVREVGTLTHKLPHGVVMNAEHRKMAARIWNVPESNIKPKPTYHTVEMFRALDRGEITFMWIQVTNPMVTMPKLKRYRDAAQKEGRFIVVSDIYPTPTTEIADVILPSACWIEREGMYGNSERRTQHFEQMLTPPGEAMSDTMQLLEVARLMGFEKQFPYKDETHIEEIYEEYRQFHVGKKHAMAPYEVLKREPGVRWPYVDGKETKWRYNNTYDPACDQSKAFDFYGKGGKAHLIARPYEAPAESPDNDYPFWLSTGRVIEHWHSGSMTRRIPILHKAVPEAYVELNPLDAERMSIRNGDRVKLETRRGTIVLKAQLDGRGTPSAGSVFVPFFDESKLINELTLDALCPISKQPDYKKCAVKVSKA